MDEERRQLERLITTLQKVNERWLELLQNLPPDQREEDQRYAAVTNDNKGILKLIEDGWEAHIAITMYIEDSQKAMRRLKQSMSPRSRNNSSPNQIPSKQENESREVKPS